MIVLAHGIRQLKARSHMRPLAEALKRRGVRSHFADYGYVLIPTTNKQAVRAIRNAARPGDDLVAYSNGAWGAVQAAYQGLHIQHLYLISPALNVTTTFPPSIDRITVFYSPGDTATRWGMFWRKATRLLPWRWKNPHGWGQMGSIGPITEDPRVKEIRMAKEIGHDWWKHPSAVTLIADYIKETL